MSRNVLVINGNPKPDSFCSELVASYAESSERSNNVRLISLDELDFSIDLTKGYDSPQALEPDLVTFQESLRWAEHVVIVLPVWWGGMPAKLKGLFDRTILPGFAFSYSEGSTFPTKLLKGRTAEIIVTMDTPPFWYRWVQGNPVIKQLKRTILQFCGFGKISATYIGPVIKSTPEQRKKWTDRVGRLALKGRKQ